MTYDEDDNNQKGDPSKILLPFSQSRVSTSSKNLKNVSKVYILHIIYTLREAIKNNLN